MSSFERTIARRIRARHGALPRLKKEMSRAMRAGLMRGRPDGWRIDAGQRTSRLHGTKRMGVTAR